MVPNPPTRLRDAEPQAHDAETASECPGRSWVLDTHSVGVFCVIMDKMGIIGLTKAVSYAIMIATAETLSRCQTPLSG